MGGILTGHAALGIGELQLEVGVESWADSSH